MPPGILISVGYWFLFRRIANSVVITAGVSIKGEVVFYGGRKGVVETSECLESKIQKIL